MTAARGSQADSLSIVVCVSRPPLQQARPHGQHGVIACNERFGFKALNKVLLATPTGVDAAMLVQPDSCCRKRVTTMCMKLQVCESQTVMSLLQLPVKHLHMVYSAGLRCKEAHSARAARIGYDRWHS
jgi:hypothetical protein